MACSSSSVSSSLTPISGLRKSSPLQLPPRKSLRLCQVSRARKHSALPVPRASDLKDHGPSGEEWRPPSDWDKAWKTYKKLSPSTTPSALGGNSRDSSLSDSDGMGSKPTSNSSSRSSSGRKGAGFQSPLRHMEQYVSRSPSHSDYPLSEEPDPLRRAERRALNAWTDKRFTYAGFSFIAVIFVYMVVIVGPPA